jgi:DNA uptake protein ComE-like DNA-binding protein
MALLVVLVLVMMAALSAYGYTFYMESQYRTSRTYEEQTNARQAALNASELIAAILEKTAEKRSLLGGLENNPELFRDLVMEAKLSDSRQENNSNYWRASIIAPRFNDSTLEASGSSLGNQLNQDFAFGLENESAKIPIRDLLQWDQRIPGHAKQVLLSLPGATEPIVSAFLQELAAQASSQSSTQSSSSASSPQPRSFENSAADYNRSPETTQLRDQLQLLWLGGDLNQNYRIDSLDAAWSAQSAATNRAGSQGGFSAAPSPQAQSTTSPSFSSQNNAQQLTAAGLAWKRYLTWHSGARNESFSGAARVDLNQPDLRQLHQQLIKIWPTEWADYVVAFRQYGGAEKPATGSGSSSTSESAVAGSPNFAVPATRTLLSPLEMIGVATQMPAAGASSSEKSGKRMVFSPFQPDITQMGNYLRKLLDDVSTSGSSNGRIDINAAPLVVLMAIPSMDRGLAETIIQRRSGRRNNSSEGTDLTIAWLLQDGVVDVRRLIALEPYMSGKSDVYSCQIVGYRDDLSAVYRCTMTIDARVLPAVKRNIQTWHSWDRGFSTDELSQPN